MFILFIFVFMEEEINQIVTVIIEVYKGSKLLNGGFYVVTF